MTITANAPDTDEFAKRFPQYGPFAREKGALSGYTKQFIGAVVCSVMEMNGYSKTGKKKTIPHKYFTKGEVYKNDLSL